MVTVTTSAETLVEKQLKPDVLTVRQIIERMAKTYSTCKSYRDSGVVKTIFIQLWGKRTAEKPFTTAFVRPDRFRYEYRDNSHTNPNSYIVWRKAQEVQTWWFINSVVEKQESLDMALAGATGVSGGSAHTIPALLLPNEIGGRRITDITEMKRVDDVKLEKTDCFRIEGKFAGNPTTLWIDKVTFLIRRIDERKQFKSFRVNETTIYDPAINCEVTDKMLEFNPSELK